MRLLRGAAKVLRSIGLCAVIGLAILLAGLSFDHHRTTTLLTPTGQFAVGRITYDWRDPSQQELLAPSNGIPRELFAWVWYPAAEQNGGQTADYFPASWRSALARQRGWFLTAFMWRDFSRVHAHSNQTPSLSGVQERYPVLLMRAGLAAEVAGYTSLAEDLASHGYIVVGIDAPYRTSVVVFPDGRVIARTPQNNADLVRGEQQKQLATKLMQAWSADMSFAMNRLEELDASDPTGLFKGRLDLTKVGAFGHSLGGATALEFCRDDARCKAGVDIDGAPLGSVVSDGLKQPFFFLLSDHSGEPKAETTPVEADIRSIYDRLAENKRLWMLIRGGGHFGFADLNPMPVHIANLLHIVPLDGQRQIVITRDCLRTFFDVYLKGAPTSALKSLLKNQEIENEH